MIGRAFSVSPGLLVSGAGTLRGDASDLREHGGSVAEAGGEAAGSVSGGRLAAALSTFAAEMSARTGVMDSAVDSAAATLAGNASRYDADDAAAALLIGGR